MLSPPRGPLPCFQVGVYYWAGLLAAAGACSAFNPFTPVSLQLEPRCGAAARMWPQEAARAALGSQKRGPTRAVMLQNISSARPRAGKKGGSALLPLSLLLSWEVLGEIESCP